MTSSFDYMFVRFPVTDAIFTTVTLFGLCQRNRIFISLFQGPERGVGRRPGEAASSSASAALVYTGAERGVS